MAVPTLAEKLGTTTHLSPLLHKARRLGLGPEELEALAVQRGCDYYEKTERQELQAINFEQFSNEELAVALLNPALRYHPQTLRLGAAMLGAVGNDSGRLAQLAREERSEPVLRYVAAAGRRFEPESAFWPRLLGELRDTPPPKDGVLPHPTRFVAMTGFTRRGLETITQWIRPPAPNETHG